MTTLSEYDELNIPTWALGYLINGDKEGLTAQDIARCDVWVKSFQDESSVENASFLISVEDEEFFTKWPEFGLASTCVTGTVKLCN